MQAIVNGINCGSATTQAGRYSVSVKAGFGTGVDFQQGCASSGQNGGIVTFQSAGRQANETGQFIGHAAQELNLTFGRGSVPPVLPSTGTGQGSGGPGGAPFILLAGSLAASLLIAGGIGWSRRRAP